VSEEPIKPDEEGEHFKAFSSYDELQRMASEPGKLVLVSMLRPARIGSRLMFAYLEHTRYLPDTPENDKFEFILTKWPDSEPGEFPMLWSTMLFPMEDREVIEKVAKRCGLRLADGIPHIIGAGGIKAYPVSGPNVFTIENDKESPVYNGKAQEFEKLEDEAMEAIFSSEHFIRQRVTEELDKFEQALVSYAIENL
jgi:hypothetical protein